ncbi:unnamed protein product [Chrysodeixis includens]|uniref:Non-structural maintenance of chromosomes element 4 n=1 Tax=Chrysodeixis includens TaxID=689277 RepID=A0A9P0C0M9_CHRIL|nr:unnamed protein product [Chrysodeixis includens]
MTSMNNTQSSRSSMGSHDRKLRYRALLEDLSVLEDDDANNMELIDKTATAVNEAKRLLAEGGVDERVKHPGESYLDSRVLRAASDLAVRYSEAVSGNVHTYDKQMLAQHIRENPQFWEFPFPAEVPPVGFLFGTFAATPAAQRPRAARQHVQRQQAAEERAPDNVDRLEKVEEGSAMVSRVLKFINKWYKQQQKPLSYFHTVLDPTSFSKTVENVYHVSFLVRDGSIAVELDEVHRLPFITPVSKSRQEARDLADEKQFIVSIDMQRWQDLIAAFSIERPMMVLQR